MTKSLKIILVILVFGISVFLLVPNRELRLRRQAEPIQASLESYRLQKGRYPHSLSEIGIVERDEGPLYYQRKSESSYILWFGLSLGESKIFESTDGQWH